LGRRERRSRFSRSNAATADVTAYGRKAHVGIEKKEELAFGHLRELRTSPRFSQPSRRRTIPEDHPEPGIGQGRKDVLGPVFRALFVDEDLVIWVILAEKGAQALPDIFCLIPYRNENRNFLGLFGLSFRKSGEASEIQKGEGQKDEKEAGERPLVPNEKIQNSSGKRGGLGAAPPS
jgi:hypothetical protein